MEITVNETKTYKAAILEVSANVRYWEDAEINGEKDESGANVPFKVGDLWKPRIDIESGTVIDWPKGTEANIHFKVCDEGNYTLKTSEGKTIVEKDGYVPAIMCPEGGGFGDYIIMKIDGTGKIENWKQTMAGFDGLVDVDDIDEEEGW